MATQKEIIEIEVQGTGKALTETEKLTKSIEQLSASIEKSGKEAEKAKDEVEDIGKSGKKSKKGLKAVSVGLKGIGVALKAAGIGLIIGLFTGLASIMSENQKVMDGIKTVTTALSLTFNAITTAISDAWSAVSDATGGFDAMKKVISGLMTLAITPLKLAFFAIKSAIISAQLGWEQSFLGKGRPEKIKELKLALQETKDDIKRVGLEAVAAGKSIATNFVEAVTEVGALAKGVVSEVSDISLKAIVQQSKQLVQLKNNAELAVAQQGLLIEKYDIQAEKLRQIRDEERNSIEDRKKANNELKAVLDSQEKSMIKLADLQIAAARAEVNRNNTIENQAALTDALANKQGVLAQIEGKRSEQKANDLALSKEEIELNNSLSESESRLFIERKRFNAEQIEDEHERLLALEEIDLLEQEREEERLQTLIDNLENGTQAQADAQISLDEFKEKSRQQNATRDKAIQAQKDKDRKAEIAKDKALQQQKTSIAIDSFNLLSDLLGKNTKAGKAAAIAAIVTEQVASISQIISNTAIANAKSVAASPLTLGQPFVALNTISAGLSIASSVAGAAKAIGQLKSDKTTPSQASALKGGGRASAPSIPTETPQAQAPSFNITDTTGVNQLAESIGGQSQRPVRTFVVASDVTTAQNLDNNIIEGAVVG